jgi:hypothetical protein
MFEFNKKNFLYWAHKYEESCNPQDKTEEERLKKNFKGQRYLTQRNLYDILIWKSPRIKHYARENKPSKITEITRNSFAEEDEKCRIESLLGQKGGLRGVGYPVASVILHFAFPDKYPIMDFRVIRSLKMNQPPSYKFAFWENYCKTIRCLSKKYGLSIRMIDKALWKFDKEQRSHINNCRRCN